MIDLLKVIERLGSSEAFGVPFMIDDTVTGDELKARITYAREELIKFKREYSAGIPQDAKDLILDEMDRLYEQIEPITVFINTVRKLLGEDS